MAINKLLKQFEEGEISKPEFIEAMYYENHDVLFEYREHLGKTKIKKIEITKDGVIFESDIFDIKMIGVKKDFRSAPIEILNFFDYEPSDSKMMCNLIKNHSSIFDIGANAGWYSLLFSKMFPDSDIYCFEPIESVFKLLSDNIRLNGVTNIHPFNFGLSNADEKIPFYFYPEGSVNASAANVSERENISIIECEVKKLDSCIHDISKGLDFVKCDVEGAELLVFQGGLKSLEKYKPIIFSEILRKWSKKFNYHPNDIIELLSGIGYQCFVVENDKLARFQRVDEKTIHTNYFFLSKENHQDLIERYSA